MVTILKRPVTLLGRSLEVERLAKEELLRFESNSSTRVWSAESLPQRKEMHELGPLLQQGETDRITALVEGSLATELTETIYVAEGLQASGSNRVSRSFYEDFWGPQERRHWQALELCLTDSGLRTPRQVEIYSQECRAADPWSFKKQTGYSGYDRIFATAYARFQELQTKLTYLGMADSIWREYAFQLDSVGKWAGIGGVLRTIAIDEGAHEAFFLRMMRIYLRYFPERALDALVWVLKGYKMPVVVIPNAAEFISAVIWAKLYDPRWVVDEVFAGTKGLGLENRLAVRNALVNFGHLLDRDDVVLELPGKSIGTVPEGCSTYRLLENGSFVLAKAAA